MLSMYKLHEITFCIMLIHCLSKLEKPKLFAAYTVAFEKSPELPECILKCHAPQSFAMQCKIVGVLISERFSKRNNPLAVYCPVILPSISSLIPTTPLMSTLTISNYDEDLILPNGTIQTAGEL